MSHYHHDNAIAEKYHHQDDDNVMAMMTMIRPRMSYRPDNFFLFELQIFRFLNSRWHWQSDKACKRQFLQHMRQLSWSGYKFSCIFRIAAQDYESKYKILSNLATINCICFLRLIKNQIICLKSQFWHVYTILGWKVQFPTSHVCRVHVLDFRF